jgi:phenylpropionate dioxygenase-like ring-hydroxylating dioxygenase large terminal subunit
MQHATQVALSKRILAHLDARTTDTMDGPDAEEALTHTDIAAFTCPDRPRREWERLFLGMPQCVALSGQIRETGDFLTNDDLRVPILVTRDSEGRARAYLNICRHHGARLTTGCGKARRSFTCPLHGWTYGTNGHLIEIPGRPVFDSAEQALHALTELPLEESHGMIWVAPRPEIAADPSPDLKGLDEELARYGFGGYHHYETRTGVWKMNWKIAIDTFLGSGHFPVLHEETVAPSPFANLSIVDTFGQNSREVVPRRAIIDFRDKPEDDWNLVEQAAIVYILFPNIVVVVQNDHYEIWRFYPVEGKVDEVKVHLDFHIPEPVTTDEAAAHWRRTIDLVMRAVETECVPIGEAIQANMLFGGREKITQGRHGPALHHFEKTVAEAVEARSPDSEPRAAE